MIIKVSTAFPKQPIERQTPGSSGVWEDCIFQINEPVKECDWWVVYEGLIKEEQTLCFPEHTILITGEPPSIKSYHPHFVNQFGIVITSHRQIKHPFPIYNQQALPWHVGLHQKDHQNPAHPKGYDELKSLKPQKQKLISVITSHKTITRGHKNRYAFVAALKNHFKDQLDVFGRGLNEIPDKWDAIAPYRYHVVLENSSYPDYWTEKLADAFLGLAYPFYFGCPNIFDYFPNQALTPIEIRHPKKAFETIEEAIQSNRYQASAKYLVKAKEKVLEEYNFFPMIRNLVTATVKPTLEKRPITLKPEQAFKKPLPKILKSWLLRRLNAIPTKRTPWTVLPLK